MALPKEWVATTIDYLFDVIGGGTPSTKKTEYWNEVGVPWFSSADIDESGDIAARRHVTTLGLENSTTNIAPKGSIIVVTRVGLGKVAFLKEDMCFSQDNQALLPFVPETLHNRYVFYFLNNAMQTIKYSGRGTTISGITKKQLTDCIFPLPPLAEQRRIVSKIDALFSELDKGVEVLQTVRQQLRTYRQAVLKWAFARDGFIYRPLTELGDLGRGKSKHRPRNDQRLFHGGKYPFVQTGEVKAANGKIKEYTAMYGDFGLAQSKLWPIGTLCITIAANIAETAFLGIEACFPDSIVGFTANEELVIPKYVDFFIQSAKQRLWYYAPATAQKNINLNTLENLIVPYCPKIEQEQLVFAIESRLSVCDKLEQIIDENLDKAKALRQSILKKAFAGQLVPQDPNDEPAEKLLERIKAAKATATTRTSSTRRKRK